MLKVKVSEGGFIAVDLFEVLHPPSRVRQQAVNDGRDQASVFSSGTQIAPTQVHELVVVVEVIPHEVVAEPLAFEWKIDGDDVDSAVDAVLTSDRHLLVPINSFAGTTVYQQGAEVDPSPAGSCQVGARSRGFAAFTEIL